MTDIQKEIDDFNKALIETDENTRCMMDEETLNHIRNTIGIPGLLADFGWMKGEAYGNN